MSFWSGITHFFRKIAPIVLPIVAIFAPELIPAIGSSIMGTSAAITAGTATAAEVAAATAAGSAAVSGATTALSGGSPKDILKSAALAGAGSEVASQFAPSTMEDFSKAQYPGDVGSKLGDKVVAGVTDAGGSRALAQGLSTATGRFITGTGSSLAQGKSLGDSAKLGLTGSAAGAVKDYAFPTYSDSTTGEKAASSLGRGVVDYAASSLNSPSSGTTSGSTSKTSPSGYTPVGSQALAQVLNVDPGSSLFGSSKEGEKKNVWNTQSLKDFSPSGV